jgi:DNA-binding MarR family transcriptional regulator
MSAKPRSAPVDATLQQDAHALHEALTQLLRVYQLRDRDNICCYDISVTQCHALETLASRGALRSQALAQALCLDKSTVTRVVDALVRKGYVERASDPDDARALALRITRSGRALYEKIDAALVAQQAELLRGLDHDVRIAATDIIRRLASAAAARFAGGVSVGACQVGRCAPGAGADACG